MIFAPPVPSSRETDAPIFAYTGLPVWISCWATYLAWLIGIAKPRPMEPDWPEPPRPPLVDDWIAELMPITAPEESSSGPPELPGLIEASVCRALMYEDLLLALPSLEATGRFFALMMPVVTVLDRPNGAPIAIVGSPTATWSELPRTSGFRSEGAFFSLMTATSYP